MKTFITCLLSFLAICSYSQTTTFYNPLTIWGNGVSTTIASNTITTTSLNLGSGTTMNFNASGSNYFVGDIGLASGKYFFGSVFATNVLPGGQLPIGTVATNTAFDGAFLRSSNSGTARVWTTDLSTATKLPPRTNTIFTAFIDDGGSVIATGVRKGFPVAGDSYTISGWSITAMGNGPTCTLDVWKITTGTALPTVANTIMGIKPALATGNALVSTTLTSWNTTVTKGDIWGINVDACSGATNIVFQIFGYRN